MAHAQKPDFVFRRKGRVHLSQRGRQFSRLLAVEVCASAVVMLDTPCSEVVWRVLATHFIRQFPLHFPSCASLCAITFQLDSTYCYSNTTIVTRTLLSYDIGLPVLLYNSVLYWPQSRKSDLCHVSSCNRGSHGNGRRLCAVWVVVTLVTVGGRGTRIWIRTENIAV